MTVYFLNKAGQVSVWNMKPRNTHHHSYGKVKTSLIFISEPSSALGLRGGGEVLTRNLNLKTTWIFFKKMSKRKCFLRGLVVRKSAPSKKQVRVTEMKFILASAGFMLCTERGSGRNLSRSSTLPLTECKSSQCSKTLIVSLSEEIPWFGPRRTHKVLAWSLQALLMYTAGTAHHRQVRV